MNVNVLDPEPSAQQQEPAEFPTIDHLGSLHVFFSLFLMFLISFQVLDQSQTSEIIIKFFITSVRFQIKIKRSRLVLISAPLFNQVSEIVFEAN